jgi:hypothetical protein
LRRSCTIRILIVVVVVVVFIIIVVVVGLDNSRRLVIDRLELIAVVLPQPLIAIELFELVGRLRPPTRRNHSTDSIDGSTKVIGRTLPYFVPSQFSHRRTGFSFHDANEVTGR